MQKNKTYWKICSGIVIFLAILVFTPLVIPIGKYKPMVYGIPYSLWTSYLITIALVILTFIGTKVHIGNQEEEDAV